VASLAVSRAARPGLLERAAPGSGGPAGSGDAAGGGGPAGSAAGDASGSASGEASGGQAAGTGGQGPGGSKSEQIGRRLDETFGTFDAAVRTAQADIAKEREAAGGAAGGSPGEDEEGAGAEGGAGGEGGADAEAQREGGLESTGGSTGGAGEAGEAGEAGTGNAESGAPDSQQGGVGGGTGPAGKGPSTIPADIPDGRDDDIVARQIREAAMKETDPELREALWEEYRRYKKGS
jgi:hypothetical protein